MRRALVSLVCLVLLVFTAGGLLGQTSMAVGNAKPDAVLPTVSVLYAFGSTSTDGDFAQSSLIQASDGNFYGTTPNGGGTSCDSEPSNRGCGTIYSISPAGVYTQLYAFKGGSDGIYPNAGLVQAEDGYLYGATEGSEDQNIPGTLYKILPGSTTLTTVYTFPYSGGAYGSLVPDASGNLYGLSYSNGGNQDGNLFLYNITTGYKDLYDFRGTDGKYPEGSPLVGADGHLYGTTTQGGPNGDCDSPFVSGFINSGTVWEFDLATGTLSTVYSFNGASNGPCAPLGGLVQAANGTIYGTTSTAYYGDASGALFQVVPAGSSSTVSIIHAFSSTDGEPVNPAFGTMVTDANNNIYYAGEAGAANNDGGFAAITTTGVVTTLHSFASNSGYNPYAQAAFGQDGNFYGVTSDGSTYSDGEIYKAATDYTPVISITPNLAAISAESTLTLTWATTNAFSKTMQACFGSSSDGTFTGYKPASGSDTVVPKTTGTATYAITCGGVESATTSVTVTPGSTKSASTTVTTASPAPVSVGQPVTIKATVSGSNGTPTGSVVFSFEGNALDTATLSSGVASFTVPTGGLPPGTYPIVATYGGSSTYNGSASTAYGVVVDAAPTSATLVASPNPVNPPATVMFTATVKRSATGATGTPTGTVAFQLDGTTLDTATLNSGGVATFSISTNGLPAGSYPIIAKYSGDGSDTGSSSATYNVTIK